MVLKMDYNTLFKKLGFTDYETKVYLALVRLSSAKAGNISKHSGVPANKVYESLIRLAEKGFISYLDLSPRIYKITGVEKLREEIEKREKNLSLMLRTISSLDKDLSKSSIYTQDIATALRGKKNIISKLNEQTPNTTQYQYSFGGGLSFTAKSGRTVAKAIKRGIDIRFLVHKDPARKSIYDKWRKIGVKIRFHPKAEQKSIRFSTMDDKIARMTVGKPQIDNENDYLTFWLESPAFASLLKDQFLEMWEKAKE